MYIITRKGPSYVKRIFYFILGLWIFITVGIYLFLYIDISAIQKYQDTLQQYSWFNPTLYWTSGLLMLLAFLLLIWSFRPSHKAQGLLLSYPDGEIFINKKSIEKTVLHTLNKYDGIRQPAAKVKLFKKSSTSFIDIDVDLFVLQTENIQAYLSTIREDIKTTTENFSELAVREVNINLLDQKDLSNRVL